MTVSRTVQQGGVAIPTFFYGTAWKEERTEALTRLALECGFTAVDSANQRKHYHEAGVGAAVRGVPGLFLQSKFTHRDSQDDRLPYDPRAEVEVQVEQSFASTLEHLGVAVLDAYVLHGPSWRRGWAPQDLRAWRAMEALHAAGGARILGVSNVTAEQLDELCGWAAVPPALVQNRCYAAHGWERAVRQVCARRQVVYQGFSLLTANRSVLADPEVVTLARQRGTSETRLVFRLCLELGMIALTGTSRREHMLDDLAAYHDPPLGAAVVSRLEERFAR